MLTINDIPILEAYVQRMMTTKCRRNVAKQAVRIKRRSASPLPAFEFQPENR